MNGYKVALIIEEMDQSYQTAILNGIASSAAEFSLNISVFVSFSGTINSDHEKGEFNIFNLPDFRDFDGAILLTNTLDQQSVVNEILGRIKDAGIPAVSIDNDIPYLYHVGIDNKSAMRHITEHLINVHGYRRFGYISGPESNPESADRLASFLEVLKEHDIPISDDYIFYGNFRAPSGRAAVEHFLSLEYGLPEVIISANDVMAVSAINCLTEKYISVPEDIAVTGFDNTYSTHNYQVELTSVDRPLALSGRIACKMLANHFNKVDQDRSVILNMSPRFTESCGCSHNTQRDLLGFKELNYRNYLRFEKSQNFMSQLNKLSVDLLSTDSFEQYIEILKEFTKSIDPEEYYFCLCDNLLSDVNIESPISGGTYDIGDTSQYTDELIVPIAYVRGEFIEVDTVKRRDIIPSVSDNGKSGKLFYHIPLHFGKRCFGYMVVYNSSLPLHNSMFETFCITLSNSIENIRKLITLESALAHLGKLYAHDTFSGIYNRNGFVQATDSVYRDCVHNHRDVMLMFIDLDGLKKINDTYGHNIGDNAICSIAKVLVKSCVNGEIYCRFGGDEFIVFAADYTESDAKRLTETIEKNIAMVNESGANPFTLSASTGYVIAKPQEGEDIFNFVTDADNVMYIQKRKKKLSKYLKG
ncbi:MAG: GGDEF domain-containing protein [Ruminococcus sp.]|nr:GGDEF domain-containing protein [Ruminococcus sp.]